MRARRDCGRPKKLACATRWFIPSFKGDRFDDSAGEVVDAASDLQLSVPDQACDDRGRLGENLCLIADVRFNGDVEIPFGDSHRRSNVLEQAADLAGDFGPLKRGGHGSAGRMAENEKHFCAQQQCAKFETADVFTRGYIPRNTRDEQVPKSLIEHHLDGNARIGAAEKRGERSLFWSDGLDSFDVAVGRCSRQLVVRFQRI